MITTQLSALESADLVRLAQSRPELEYLFRHALVQDAAYSVLLLSDRQRIHHAVGETLERRYPDRPDELAPFLGHHFALAGDNERAFRYFSLAGDAAGRAYALDEAITLYSRALQAQTAHSPAAQLIHLYKSRGQAYYALTRWQEAWDNYQELEQLGRQRQDRSLELHGLLEQATMRAVFNPLSDFQEAQIISDRALALAEEIGDQAAQATILWNLMRIQSMNGSSELAVSYGEQSLALARQLALSEQVAYTLNDLQYVYRANGRVEDALATLAEARAFWQANNRLHILADNLNQTAGIHLALGNFDLCIACLDQASQISQASNNRTQSSFADLFRGVLAAEQGNAIQSLTYLEKARDNLMVGSIFSWREQATLYQNYGLFDEAVALLELVREALSTAPPSLQFTIGRLVDERARLALQQGQLAQAEAIFQTAAPATSPDLARAQLFFGRSLALMLPAELLLARGDFQAALDALEDVLAFLRPLRANRFLTNVLLLQSQASLALGRTQQAHTALTEARTLAEGMNQRRTLWRIYAALGRLEQQRGDPAAAESFIVQAHHTIHYIASHAPADLRASFLALPEVEEILGTQKASIEFPSS
jgi:hypothetical protein